MSEGEDAPTEDAVPAEGEKPKEKRNVFHDEGLDQLAQPGLDDLKQKKLFPTVRDVIHQSSASSHGLEKVRNLEAKHDMKGSYSITGGHTTDLLHGQLGNPPEVKQQAGNQPEGKPAGGKPPESKQELYGTTSSSQSRLKRSFKAKRNL